MKTQHIMCRLFIAAIICGTSTVYVLGQNVDDKKFADGGVAFDYKPEWELTANNTADTQQISLSNKEADSQILITVIRKRTESKDPMADLKKQTIDPWLASLARVYTQVGIKVSARSSRVVILRCHKSRRSTVCPEDARSGILFNGKG